MPRQKSPESYHTMGEGAGGEFQGPTKDYFNIMDIKQRNKETGDPNALGVIDRAIRLLRKKLATIVATESGDWGSQLEKATNSLNSTPKPEILHGEAPNTMEESDAAQFMLLQHNAENIKHNDDLGKQTKNQSPESRWQHI